MNKAEFAQLIDAYADAKASGNKYLLQRMITDLEEALSTLFCPDPEPLEMVEE
jgi:hypothetical protein